MGLGLGFEQKQQASAAQEAPHESRVLAKKDFCGSGSPTAGAISHLVRVRVKVRVRVRIG